MAKNNVWMSVSDLMTGLMVIFLFVAVAYIAESDKIITRFVDTQNQLKQELDNHFNTNKEKWNMVIGDDLSIRFTRSSVLFDTGKDSISSGFKAILNEFVPSYLDVVLNEKYVSSIKEIRIEGHTDDVPFPGLDRDPYIANVILSQRRATSVLRYIRNMECYRRLPENHKERLQYWFTANGLSYGHTLDEDNNETFVSRKDIDRDRCRRVEFRIITNSDKVINDFIK